MAVEDPQELSSRFAELVSRGDVDGVAALYEDGATLFGPDGRAAVGAGAIRELVASMAAMSPTITAQGVEPQFVDDDVALLLSRWTMQLATMGGAVVEGSSTELARRQPDGGWLYVLDRPVAEGFAAAAEDRADPRPSFEQLRYEVRGPVARITLNRPQARNALTMRLSGELIEALRAVRDSSGVRVLVIDGAGETFCAGDDITEMPSWGNADDVMRRVRRYQEMANALEELDRITVAAVDGFAVGGGLEITMACDFVVATRRARWGMPEIDVGITPGWGGTTRMARLIGRRMTKEVNLLGALHPAERAIELGLWNRVVEDDRLEREVDALVEVLLSKNQQAARQLKFIVNRGVEADQYTAQGFEALSAALSGAVNCAWKVPDADGGRGVLDFAAKGELWRRRRDLARDFWADAAAGQTR